MNYKVVESREIVWCDSDDRYILIIKENEAIVGLNFMQGDELDLFKEQYSDIDYDLTDFFNAVEPFLGDGDQVDRINAAIWSFHEYSVLRDELEYKNNNK